jgi:hypothetical protein
MTKANLVEALRTVSVNSKDDIATKTQYSSSVKSSVALTPEE